MHTLFRGSEKLESSSERPAETCDAFGFFLSGGQSLFGLSNTWNIPGPLARLSLGCCGSVRLAVVGRTGQRFGAGHLIDILRGNVTERVQRFRHDELKTFNVGADLTDKQWRAVFRQLVALGFLAADAEAYGAFKLTDAARDVLKGETTVSLREEAEPPRKRERSKKADFVSSLHGPVSGPLLDALRKWRYATAREHGVPAYVIFHDSTLEAIAATQPRTLDALRGISGVGAKKLEQYGEALLKMAREN
jgi:ATP-dependent DNA helicase RecQ